MQVFRGWFDCYSTSSTKKISYRLPGDEYLQVTSMHCMSPVLTSNDESAMTSCSISAIGLCAADITADCVMCDQKLRPCCVE